MDSNSSDLALNYFTGCGIKLYFYGSHTIFNMAIFLLSRFSENRFNILKDSKNDIKYLLNKGDHKRNEKYIILLLYIICFTSYSQNKQISYSSVNGLVTRQWFGAKLRYWCKIIYYTVINISNKILN